MKQLQLTAYVMNIVGTMLSYPTIRKPLGPGVDARLHHLQTRNLL